VPPVVVPAEAAPTVAAAPAAPTAPAAVPAPAVGADAGAGFPELRLQGIYYRLNRPSALINGETVEIGDHLGDAKVIKIERRSVTLERGGQRKVLMLGAGSAAR
jgi:MSHA biogenesis protein MshK